MTVPQKAILLFDLMILGIGTDIIEVKRIDQAIKRFGKRFLDRIFTLNEQQYCMKHRESARHYAGRFAAKEAVVKAMGTGFREGITWTDIEISLDGYGKPIVLLSEAIKKRWSSHNVLITISHCHDYATASAILQLKTEY